MSDIKTIDQFWKLKKDNKIEPENLNETIKEYFQEDFVENFSYWKNLITALDSLIEDKYEATGLNSADFPSINFDYFCQTMFHLFEIQIEETGNIEKSDIPILLETLVTDYFYNLANDINKKLAYETSKENPISKLIHNVKRYKIIRNKK